MWIESSVADDINSGRKEPWRNVYISARNITERASVPKTADMLTLRLLCGLFGSFIVRVDCAQQQHHTTHHWSLSTGPWLRVERAENCRRRGPYINTMTLVDSPLEMPLRTPRFEFEHHPQTHFCKSTTKRILTTKSCKLLLRPIFIFCASSSHIH